MSNQLAPKLATEFIGTFAFVFIGAGTAAVLGDGVCLPGMLRSRSRTGSPLWLSPSPTGRCLGDI
jgi:hypothetical protein